MKQYITFDQLNELSEKGKEKLRGLWKPTMGDWSHCFSRNTCIYPVSTFGCHIIGDAMVLIKGDKYYQMHLPLLSIGQMIEFLDDKKYAVTCEQWQNDGEGKSLKGKGSWRVGLNWLQGDSEETSSFYYVCENKELCDALWKTVKEVLNE